MAEHRWQGYSHEELYKSINAGPGPRASHTSIERWQGVAAALTDINADLHAGVLSSGAKWEGAAGDMARAGLNPLAAWADEAKSGAEVMRISAEMQADHISKARADMPPPVKVTAEQPNALVSGLTHLFGSQTDFEKQEAAQDAAEKRAREVMSTYASSTTTNTNTLGQFNQPPQLVINASAPTRAEGPGVAAPMLGNFAPSGTTPARGNRRGARPGQARPAAAPPQQRPVAPVSAGGGTTGTSSASTSQQRAGGAASPTAGSAPGGVPGGPAGAVPNQQQRRKEERDSTAASSAQIAALAPAHAQAAAASNAAATAGSMMAGGTIGVNNDSVHRRATPMAPAFDPFGSLGAGRSDDEEDAVHESADYLRETDDIYGVGSYTLPVIGESTTD